MNNLMVVVGDFKREIGIKEYKGNRVVTLRDIDEIHDSAEGSARKNFNYNKKRFIEGEDYFVLNYDEAKTLFGIRAPQGLIVVTESGYLMLTKSLQDDLAWEVQKQLVKTYFKAKEIASQSPNLTGLSPTLQVLISLEQRQNEFEARQSKLEEKNEQNKVELEEVKEVVNTMAESKVQVPDSAIINKVVSELVRWTRLEHEEVFNRAYELLKQKHGIDIPKRLNNERIKLQSVYQEKTGKTYKEKTLKSKVSGVAMVVRTGCVEEMHEILVGWLAKEKAKSKLRVV